MSCAARNVEVYFPWPLRSSAILPYVVHHGKQCTGRGIVKEGADGCGISLGINCSNTVCSYFPPQGEVGPDGQPGHEGPPGESGGPVSAFLFNS